jgi:hypothetical protein
MNRLALFGLITAATVSAAAAETVYVYDDSGKYSKSINEIAVWKDPAIPQKIQFAPVQRRQY